MLSLYINLVAFWVVVNNSMTNTVGHRNDHDEWVVRIEGGSQVASLLALQSGYKYLGPVLGFKDTYVWLHDSHAANKKRGGVRLTKALNSSTKIIWADQQKAIERHKRDYMPPFNLDSEKPLIREKRLEVDQYQLNSIDEDEKSGQKFLVNNPEGSTVMFNDELWDQEWYLQDTRSNKALPKLDLNVLPLYRLGVTGRGVRIAVLDDGLEYTHDDLRNNYDPDISYDVNEGDDDPLPRYELSGAPLLCHIHLPREASKISCSIIEKLLSCQTSFSKQLTSKLYNKIYQSSQDIQNWMNGHGTRCAGEIAMEANNGKCGVGVAFESSVGGIKLLDGLVNDRVEGEALGYKPELVDIYTASWGPADDGKSLEAPGRLATEALERGVTMGRDGKGNIYVWASGNGGSKSDDCGCDGYVGSIYTIAVGSASQTGRFPWYGESCPATLATTYSSGAYHDQMIATTDLRNTCTTGHTGTSASAPLAAGILALALQVNKDLTWRDVQHLIVWTSEYSPLRENPGWFRNSAGFWFNSRFGFGLMNAYSLVSASSNWTAVSDKIVCRVDATEMFLVSKPQGDAQVLLGPLKSAAKPVTFYVVKLNLPGSALQSFVTVPIDKGLAYGSTKKLLFEVVDECRSPGDGITFMEHVEIEVSLGYNLRGALQMHLTAPSGTKVQVLKPRKLDTSAAGFEKWKFMSVASWGEDPRGTWILDIVDEIGPEKNSGAIETLALILHGTRETPGYRKNGPRVYNQDYNRMRKTYDDELMKSVFMEKLGPLFEETNDVYEQDLLEKLLRT